ncbi:MAG: HEAT repeat domain-containing protein [Candidatus Aminicenantes bacterium]|nr:HEAT repeat domain-containing protein [Candidatus Aminicenantes bacterium]
MDLILKNFLSLNTLNQVRFLKEEKFKDYAALSKEAKIEFIKNVFKCDLSSKTTAAAIKTLRELGYKDKFFYRKFLYHIDSSVSNAAKKGISESSIKKDSGVIRIVKNIRDGEPKDKIKKIKSFLKEKGSLNEEIIISLLKSDDQKVRETLIAGIRMEQEIDDRKLTDAIKSGAVWHVRAALVAILGNRKSSHLLDIIDFLIEDKNVEVRLQLIEALTKLDGEQVKPHLQKLSDDPLIWVRKRAQQALTRVAESTRQVFSQ